MTSKKLSKNVIDLWPEIFEGINLNVVPLKYLHTIEVVFKDKKIWQIEIDRTESEIDLLKIENHINDIFKTYQDDIDNVDFKLDTDQIKKDIIKETNRFLKKRKLQ